MSRAIAIIMAVVTIAAIAAGLALVGGPSEARREREDAARLEALSQVAAALACPVREAGAGPEPLPQTLTAEELAAYCGGRHLPPEALRDPVTGAPIRYERRGDRDFALCTTFHDAGAISEARLSPFGASFDPTTGCLSGRAGS